jgi:hypothetical protein
VSSLGAAEPVGRAPVHRPHVNVFVDPDHVNAPSDWATSGVLRAMLVLGALLRHTGRVVLAGRPGAKTARECCLLTFADLVPRTSAGVPSRLATAAKPVVLVCSSRGRELLSHQLFLSRHHVVA